MSHHHRIATPMIMPRQCRPEGVNPPQGRRPLSEIGLAIGLIADPACHISAL
jgi:hypothetical protein